MLNGIYQLPRNFPGLDNIPNLCNLRTIGNIENGETLGAGFLHKEKGEDFLDRATDHYALVYVIRGKGRYCENNGKIHQLKEGMIFQRFPGVTHSTYIDSEQDWFEGFIALGNHIYQALKTMGVIDFNTVVYTPHVTDEQRMDIIKKFYQLALAVTEIDEKNILRFLAEELETLQNILQANHSSDIFDTYISLVKNSPELRYSIKEFCSNNGSGYEWFRKAFKRKTGNSPTEFAVKQRIRKAKSLLQSGNKSILMISEILGYKNQYEFSAQFRKYAGVTPNHFRHQI
jgi:AraC family transcriptional regulator, arabinose operon regulatory protein